VHTVKSSSYKVGYIYKHNRLFIKNKNNKRSIAYPFLLI